MRIKKLLIILIATFFIPFFWTDSAQAAFTADCTGGTITHVGTSTIHTFTSSSTFNCTGKGSGNVQVLVVAGGGSGGQTGVIYPGGGGAGGLLYESTHAVTATSYSITIGLGGGPVSSGQNSVFDTMTSVGGGFGGSNGACATGGSGGGAAQEFSGCAGTGGQGNAGGSNMGGGGGAGGVGTGFAGSGGPGLSYSISGSPVTYATGGNPGMGPNTGASGTNGLGNGGDGAYVTAGSGGSGVVIISYQTPASTGGLTRCMRGSTRTRGCAR